MEAIQNLGDLRLDSSSWWWRTLARLDGGLSPVRWKMVAVGLNGFLQKGLYFTVYRVCKDEWKPLLIKMQLKRLLLAKQKGFQWKGFVKCRGF